jgi:hypothetical protein
VQDDPAITALLSAGARDALTHRFPLGCATGNFGNAQASVRLFAAAHVPLLAGTDAPNPGTPYGASLHEELAQLVRAGLTPEQALVAATLAPARAYGLEDRGRIAEGLRADLVLVDGDPSADITATRHLEGVWRGGVAFDRAGYLAGLAKKAEATLAGVLSDFDAGQPDSHFGAGWMPTTDRMAGGTSEASYQIVPGGAHGSAGALEISGTLHALPYAWAGALALLGDQPFAPVDLSTRPTLHFFAKGHGETLRVMLFAKHLGSRPAVQTFVAGNDWTEANLPLAAFGLDGTDLTGVAFVAGPDGGPFKFEIDEVGFR